MSKLVIYNEGHAPAGVVDLETDDLEFERGSWMAEVRSAHRVRGIERAIPAGHRTIRECAIELLVALGGSLDRRVRGVALRHHDDHVIGAAALDLHARRPADFAPIVPPRKTEEDSGIALAVVRVTKPQPVVTKPQPVVDRPAYRGAAQRARWAAYRAAAGYYIDDDLAALTGLAPVEARAAAKAAGVVNRRGRYDRASADVWVAQRNVSRPGTDAVQVGLPPCPGAPIRTSGDAQENS